VVNITPQSLVFQGIGHTVPFELEAGQASGAVWTFRGGDILPLSGIEFCSHLKAKFLQRVSSVHNFRPNFCTHFWSSPQQLHVKKKYHFDIFATETTSFLGAFANLRKATDSFVMSVCPSAWNNSAFTGRVLSKFDIWGFLKIYRQNSSFIKIGQE
jgi:hypothetical protein